LKKRNLSLWSTNPSFIGIYDEAISREGCERLISLFEKSDIVPGHFYKEGISTVDESIKKCKEISGCRFSKGDVISNNIMEFLREPVEKYKFQYPQLDCPHMDSWICDDTYAFKKFETQDDGFKTWHTEQAMGCSNRILVWTFYLNDAKSGTEFIHYPTVRAKMGRCAIWPATWTHFHRSQLNNGLKYIVSGWFRLEE
tara:strand:+ start:43 stop:636 length:594 start_codon:yes stop_codon:yes gene_type:complete